EGGFVSLKPHVISLIWANYISAQISYPSSVYMLAQGPGVIRIVGSLRHEIAPHKIVATLKLKLMLLKHKVIEHKSIASCVGRSAFSHVIGVADLHVFGKSIVKRGAKLGAIGIIIHQVALFVAGSRDASHSGDRAGNLISIYIESISG